MCLLLNCHGTPCLFGLAQERVQWGALLSPPHTPEGAVEGIRAMCVESRKPKMVDWQEPYDVFYSMRIYIVTLRAICR